MPAKYHHVKKRSASGLAQVKKEKNGTNGHANLQVVKPPPLPPSPSSASHTHTHSHPHHNHHNHLNHSHHHNHGQTYKPSPLTDLSLSPPTNLTQHQQATALLERTISRILLLRYEQDIARLYSTRLYALSLIQIPTLVLRIAGVGGAAWAAWNCCRSAGTGTADEYDVHEEEDNGKESIKDFFRALVGMDMREAGERVATKSVLWSYTALREFALAQNIPLCTRTGLHSSNLLPYYPQLKAHLEVLEAMPRPKFERPKYELSTGGPLSMNLGILGGKKKTSKGKKMTMEERVKEGLVRAWSVKNGLHGKKKSRFKDNGFSAPSDIDDEPDVESNESHPLIASYTALCTLLWTVANEFEPSGYGLILREKLINKWCECGCSTDHLGEVCERSVREEMELSSSSSSLDADKCAHDRGEGGVKNKGKGLEDKDRGGKGVRNGTNSSNLKRQGKQREKDPDAWDGRGSGVYGWGTEEEEDVWDIELDFGAGGGDDGGNRNNKNWSSAKKRSVKEEDGDEEFDEAEMTIGEIMELRYLRAEREKEKGNAAYRKGDFISAVQAYEKAHDIEPEVPHYQLNLAAAYLKLNNWIEAEKACTKALTQHPKNVKGLYRRGKARSMLAAAVNGKKGTSKRQGAIADLRAALRMQPTNEEAVKELSDLLFPAGIEDDSEDDAMEAEYVNANGASSSSGSNWGAASWSGSGSGAGASSSSSSGGASSKQIQTPKATKDPPHVRLLQKLGVLLPPQTRSLSSASPFPFARTDADNRKLKLVLLPPSKNSSGGGTLKVNLNGVQDGKRKITVEFSSNGKTTTSGNLDSEKAKEKDVKKEKRQREMEKMRGECVSYPSWERYAVKRL